MSCARTTDLMKSRTVSVSIALPPAQVYDFTANPENLPRWAPAFCRSIAYENGEWIIQSPDGPAAIRFTERNAYGILDHSVRLPSSQEIRVPMRVIPNGEGSEVCLTLFQAPGMTEEQFAEDARLVGSDLHNLKRVLEER
ncbi:MAG: polyketide cyclase [Gallionellales bacterium GWA2_60_18]|nr:MAG: polyketide cyclase [Gallionellales bacterium GWA2_60_18]